jgi:hypothetical protein
MPLPPDSATSRSSRSLGDRLQEQVTAASRRLAARPHGRRARSARTEGDSARELRALTSVFRDLGRSQRAARRQTGQAPSPVVREAALEFRRAPSFAALVLVAAALDEIGLLAW